MLMMIHYPDGCSTPAILLRAHRNTLRLAVLGAGDVCEFTWLDGQWLSDTLEPVSIESESESAEGFDLLGEAFASWFVMGAEESWVPQTGAGGEPVVLSS